MYFEVQQYFQKILEFTKVPVEHTGFTRKGHSLFPHSPRGGNRGIGEYIPLEAMPPLLPFPDRNAPSIEKRLFCFV